MKFILALLFSLFFYESNAQINSDVPIGTVVAYLGDVKSFHNDKWMICDGRSLLIKYYIELFQIIEWNYGYGDEPKLRKHFSLPQLGGMFLRGVDLGAKVDPDAANRRLPYNENVIIGDRVGSLQRDAIQKHKHDDKGHSHTTNATVAAGQVDSDNSEEKAAPPNSPTGIVSPGYADLTDPTNSKTGGGEPRLSNETRPINLSVVWIIRVK